MDGSDWSNGIRYHIFNTRSDIGFKQKRGRSVRPWWTGGGARGSWRTSGARSDNVKVSDVMSR